MQQWNTRCLRCLTRGDLRLKLKNGSSPHRGRSLPVQRQVDNAHQHVHFTPEQLTRMTDEPLDRTETAHGEEGGAAMFQAGTAAVESFESTVSQTQHEFTNLPDGMPSTPARFARITRTEIAPGTAPAYLALISKRAEAQRQLGIPIIRRTLVEGAAGVYTAVQFYNTLAERDQSPPLATTLNELFGEAEMAQIIEDGSRGIRYREFVVIEHRPDLSR